MVRYNDSRIGFVECDVRGYMAVDRGGDDERTAI